MDDELFGKKKNGRQASSKKGLPNIDDLFGEPQKGKKSRKNIDDFFPTKKPTVSFLDELSDTDLHEREQLAAASNKNKSHTERSPNIGNNMPPTHTPSADQLTNSVERTPSDMEDIFGPAPRRGVGVRTGKPSGSSFIARTAANKVDESERTYGLNRPQLSSQNGPTPTVTTASHLDIFGYDRTQRLENEIDHLNREIDVLKRKQIEQEAALIGEWTEKLKRRERQHEGEFADLEENQRKQLNRLKSNHEEMLQTLQETFQKQIETIMEGRNESKSYEEMLIKVDELTARIGEAATTLRNQTDKSSDDRSEYVTLRERQLEVREERLKKEEERLADEKRHVNELNLKLQSLYDSSEQKALQEKWQIREERQKLNAEKEAFKKQQRKILDSAEQQRLEIEASRSNFLREQHDLLIRVIAAKSSLEAEKVAFDAQRDRDVTRLKMEAEQLDKKLKQVQNAEDLLQNTQRIYEQKYKELVGLEQALVDECFELERCRRQMEAVRTNIPNEGVNRSEEQMPHSLDTSMPDFVIDPYTGEKPNHWEKESYDAVLKMHAGTLESLDSLQNLNPI